MTFLNSFEAVRYRGIDGLSFPHLAPANLITGVNGIGKTAVLEAMWLFTGRYNASLLWNANIHRSNKPVLDPVARLTKGALELRGVENGGEYSLEVSFQRLSDPQTPEPLKALEAADNPLPIPPPIGRIDNVLDGHRRQQNEWGVHLTPFGSVIHALHRQSATRPPSIILGARFQPEVGDEYLKRYSDLVRENLKTEFTEAISMILPGVRDLEILADEMGEPYLSAVTPENTRLPLNNLGGGVTQLSRLFLDLFSARDGAVYVDEIESGLHHSVLEKIWAFARVWMQQWNVQLVATTHSDECIHAAMAAFEDAPDELAIHKLYRNAETGKVEVTTFTGEALEGARDLNLEIR